MIDHTGIIVSNLEKSKLFYEKILAPIGYKVLMDIPKVVTGKSRVIGFGAPPKPSFWLSEGTPNIPPLHIAFRGQNHRRAGFVRWKNRD